MALLSYAAAVVIEVTCWRHLSLKTLVGIPELRPVPAEQQLIEDGIYSRIRYPRYLDLILGVLAVTLFANYLVLYVFLPVFIGGIYVITVMEEREFVARFGERYERYQARVPRLLPRLRARVQNQGEDQ